MMERFTNEEDEEANIKKQITNIDICGIKQVRVPSNLLVYINNQKWNKQSNCEVGGTRDRNIDVRSGVSPPVTTTTTQDASLRSKFSPRRCNNQISTNILSSQKEFKGATPEIGGILALRIENVAKKLTFDKLCEKLGTYIMR